jgi:PAS domain S-box-containing protein
VRLLGWRRDEALGRTSLDLGVWVSPEARASWAAELQSEGRITNREAEFRTRGGDLRRVLASSELIDIGGETCALVMAADITERKLAEEKFTKVFQACPVPISVSRLEDGRYIDINDAFIEQFGWKREEFLGHTSVEIGLWPSAEERRRWIAELNARGRLRSYEAQLRTKAGEPRTVLISAERITLDDQSCLIGLVHDITDRLQAEAARRASEERLREAQRIGHIGSWEMDIASQTLIWSEEIYDIFGLEPAAFPGTYEAFLDIVHPGDRSIVEARHQESVSPDTPYEMEHRIVTPQGQIRRVHERWRVFRGGGGKPPRAIGTLQDVTEAARAREEIQRLNDQLERRVQERTAELTAANRELESFAYSISHDLRAPLRSIDGFAHVLAEEYGARLDDRGHGFLDRVRRAAQRMGGLIDDILELSRVTRQEMRRVEVNLSELAAEIIDERARAEPTRKVMLEVIPGCVATGDPQLLRVLLQNLLENAWKYSAKNPQAEIEFGAETADEERVYFVRDNGVGFDMKYADRLFVPFQRLHSPEDFEGTGIGLATVARIVHRHGGRVWAEAAPGKGATIRFTLPGNHSAQ